jgi:transcriptional regulator with XRE-family HTH domain
MPGIMELTPTQAVAQSVRYARRLRGWNQAVLAKRLTELGVPTAQSTIARVERGKRGVSLDDAVALAVALDVSLTHLIAGPASDDDKIVLTPTEVWEPDHVREWIRGNFSLGAGGDKPGPYYGFLGRAEIARFRRENPNAPVIHTDMKGGDTDAG